MTSIIGEADPSTLRLVLAVKEQERAAVTLLSWTTVAKEPPSLWGARTPLSCGLHLQLVFLCISRAAQALLPLLSGYFLFSVPHLRGKPPYF